MKRGLFIVIDGIDGCGKSGQTKLLAEYLFSKSKKNHLFITREPYISKYTDQIRELLKVSKDPKENAKQLAQLFIKDRKVHAKVITQYLKNGAIVICDRYKYSTLVFQSTQGLAMSELIKMHKGLIVPDLVLIIDVPAQVAMERINKDNKRSHKEVFEQEEFLAKLRQGYLNLPQQLPKERIVFIPGEGTPQQVFEQVRAEVDKIV